MLGNYIKVDGVQYPNPEKFKPKYKNYEKVNLSESYTELTSINRLAKFEPDMTFNVSSYWLNKIIADCKKPEVKFDCNGVEYSGRLRANDSDLLENSEFIQGTDGLWTIKVKFMET